MSGVKGSVPGFAIHWANKLGSSDLSIERLPGGINNQVFRCGSDDQKWVIKGYGPVIPGQRDRMQAEVEFLKFTEAVVPKCTPKVLQIDLERRCIVIENIDGEAFREGEAPSNSELVEAVTFFRQLNSERGLAKETIHLEAAEGFLSLRKHLQNVRDRYEILTYEHLDVELRPRAHNLLIHLGRELDQTEGVTRKLIDQDFLADEIDPDSRCISPSDFGFHNAIRTSRGIYFFDFEFSGWDDPAKTIQDFILQPRVPVIQKISPLLNAFPKNIQLDLQRRCTVLAPILKLKWLCIILSVLQQKRLDNMLIIMPEEEAQTLINKRLEKAESYLERIYR